MLLIETSVMVIIINTRYVRFLDKSICVPHTIYLNLEKIIINKLRSIECKRKLQLYVMLKKVCAIDSLLIIYRFSFNQDVYFYSQLTKNTSCSSLKLNTTK